MSTRSDLPSACVRLYSLMFWLPDSIVLGGDSSIAFKRLSVSLSGLDIRFSNSYASNTGMTSFPESDSVVFAHAQLAKRHVRVIKAKLGIMVR